MDRKLARTIESLESELLRPEVRGSPYRLNELLAEDFFEFGSSGGRFTRKKVREMLPTLPETRFMMYEFRAVVLSPETVLATYDVETEVAGAGENSRSLHSSLWQKRGWPLAGAFPSRDPAGKVTVMLSSARRFCNFFLNVPLCRHSGMYRCG